jgi:hypothetical protein
MGQHALLQFVQHVLGLAAQKALALRTSRL